MKVHAGKGLVAAGGQGLIIVWSLRDFTKVATFEAHDEVRLACPLHLLSFPQRGEFTRVLLSAFFQKIHDIAFSPDGRRIVSCSQDQLLKVRPCLVVYVVVFAFFFSPVLFFFLMAFRSGL